MIKETHIFENVKSGSDHPLFEIRDLQFGIQCLSQESNSLYWYDNMGSVGKFYNLKGYNRQASKELDVNLNNKLEVLTSKNISTIKEDIGNLLQIFPIGSYTAKYIEPNDGHNDEGYNYYNVIFPTYDSSKTTEIELYNDFSKFFHKTVAERGNNMPPRLIDFAAMSFYNGCENHLLGTKHESNLDADRIKYYQEKIKSGQRPAILVLRGLREYGKTNSFIFDGHHKAVAYKNTKVNPRVVEIETEIGKHQNILENLKMADEILYKSQMIYLIRTNYMHEQIIQEIKNDQLLREYCLNGIIEEYYPNGQLEMIGNFCDLKKDGVFNYYYPDGSLYKTEKYQMEHWKATYEHYFHNGQLLIKGDDNGIIEQYDIFGNIIK